MDDKLKKDRIAFVISIIVSFIIIITIYDVIKYTGFFDAVKKIENKEVEKVSGTQYNGTLSYSFNRKINFINYSLPNGFIDRSSDYSVDLYYSRNNSQGFLISCEAIIGFVGNYEGTKELAEGISNFENVSIETVNINGIDWYKVGENSYLTEYKREILMYSFKGTESCKDYNSQIIESISFK